jgi:hypothetical protein
MKTPGTLYRCTGGFSWIDYQISLPGYLKFNQQLDLLAIGNRQIFPDRSDQSKNNLNQAPYEGWARAAVGHPYNLGNKSENGASELVSRICTLSV